MRSNRNIVVGMGNSILSDDGLGCYLTQRLQQDNGDYHIVTTNTSGFNLVDYIIEKDRAIFIDSIITGRYKPGQVITFNLKDFKNCQPFSIHSTDLINAIELYRQFNLPIPPHILFIAVEVKDNFTFKEDFSPEIKQNIDIIYDQVKLKIKNFFSQNIKAKEIQRRH